MGQGKLAPGSQSTLAAEIRHVIGAGPNDEVVVVTPQFERTPGMPSPTKPPSDFEALRSKTAAELKAMGCAQWDDEPDANGRVLMLFPGEWYDSIPEGTTLVCIDGRDETFRRGKTDDDIRFGCIAFGFRVAK